MQIGKVTSILELFSKLDCQSSINQLVEISYKAALGYLRINGSKVNKIFAENDLTFSVAAISSIAPLFCKESVDGVLPIIKEFNSWQPPIQAEEDVLFFLNKVVARRVEQFVSQLLKEDDPFFAKILDSVNYLIKKMVIRKSATLEKNMLFTLAAMK